MKNVSKKAFTLIELLVVITIIGILATTGLGIYTSQIQRGRDAKRMSQLNDLKAGIEQFYQDDSEYPNIGAGFSGVKVYTPTLPKDPKTGKSTNTTSLDYAYAVGEDGNGIANQIYEISSGLENSGTIKAKADNKEDGGNDTNRLEMGIILTGSGAGDILSTNIKGDQALTSWVNGLPTDNTCVAPDNTTDAGGEACSTTAPIMIIR